MSPDRPTEPTAALASYCPRCVQHDPTAPPSAIVRTDDWRCRRCGFRAVDADDAASWAGTVGTGEILERLYNQLRRGQPVDPDRLAVAIGRYHAGSLDKLLEDFLHYTRGRPVGLAAGTAVQMRCRLIAALVAGGFQVVAT